jgi:hypothetical protein
MSESPKTGSLGVRGGVRVRGPIRSRRRARHSHPAPHDRPVDRCPRPIRRRDYRNSALRIDLALSPEGMETSTRLPLPAQNPTSSGDGRPRRTPADSERRRRFPVGHSAALRPRPLERLGAVEARMSERRQAAGRSRSSLLSRIYVAMARSIARRSGLLWSSAVRPPREGARAVTELGRRRSARGPRQGQVHKRKWPPEGGHS